MSEAPAKSDHAKTAIGPGRLILVVGPSGAGKDTLLALARAACADDGAIVFPRRVVTREATASEDNEQVSLEAFQQACAGGGFAVHWQAHGHGYGLPLAIDDEFAKSLSFESLEKLKEMIRDRLASEYARASRDKLKRQLLDKLDQLYSFELPEGLVNQEFDSIWEQVTREQKAAGRSFADENTTEEAARTDYRKIAERRVRLGLLLAEVGTRAELKVSDDEMTQALIARAVLPRPGEAGLGLLPQQ